MASYLKLSTPLQESWTVLRDLAGAYQQDKPELDQLIRKAVGKGFAGEADRLQALLAIGEYDAYFDHQADVLSLRELLDYLDGLLDDPVLREELRDGAHDSTLITMIAAQLNVMATVAARLNTLQAAGQPVPVAGPTYNSMLFCAELAAVALSVCGFLAVSRPADLGNWIEPWAGIMPQIDGMGFWILPNTYLFPIWRNIAAVRERFAGKPNYGIYKYLVPNAFYFKKPLKHKSEYVTGEVYAALHMLHGGLKSVEEAAGVLPMGMALDPATGNVLIEDQAALQSGTYGDIMIGIHDQLGGYFAHPLEVVIQRDILPAYTYQNSRPLNQYSLGEEIAYIASATGMTVKSARIVAGQLPEGLRFSSSTGSFYVQAPAELSAGSFALQVRVVTFEKVDVVLDVVLVFADAEVFDFGTGFDLALPKPISEFATGDIVATMRPGSAAPGMMLYTYSALPSGFQFQAPDKIFWASGSQPTPGQVAFDFVLRHQDGTNLRYTFQLTFYPDDAFAYEVAAPKEVYAYLSGDVIATPLSSTIANAYANGPTFSSMYAYNVASDGSLTVVNPGSLVPGDFYMEIWTENDAQEQKTYVVPWKILAADAVTYSVADSQPVGTYEPEQQLAIPVENYPVVTSYTLISPMAMLPPGVAFDAMTGVFAVTDPASMTSGSWTAMVKIVLTTGGSETHEVMLDVLPA